MRINNDGEFHRARGWRFSLHWILMAIGLASTGSTAVAAPFAYVMTDTGVSVIDTTSNLITATIPTIGEALAVTPDGKRLYVSGAGGVAVINTATNAVVVTIPAVGDAVAITPDGAYAYVADNQSVAVIDTASNTVAATVALPPGSGTPDGIAIAPDGIHAYVTSYAGPYIYLTALDMANSSIVATVALFSFGPANGVAVTPDGKLVYLASTEADQVWAIDTSTFSVVPGAFSGRNPLGVAIAPEGARAYVPYLGFDPSTVAVIDTSTNTEVASVSLPLGPNAASGGIAITPDGKSAYITTDGSVLVMDTVTNMVVAAIPFPSGTRPFRVAIIPDIPYHSMQAALAIESSQSPSSNAFELDASFALGSGSSGINPVSEPVTLQIDDVAATIPSGSFKGIGSGLYTFSGTIDGLALEMAITRVGVNQYVLVTTGQNASFAGTSNPMTVRLSIGVDSGTTSTHALLINLARQASNRNATAGASISQPHG
jgi:YVTN family beta-propeller protein